MNGLADDAWFAGFVAGEGCFFITPASAKRGCLPGLAICLRADDAAVLYEIREAFGGNVSGVQAREGRRAPQHTWRASSKCDLIRLVEYFDRFPLRAKKARDYVHWRMAVLVYINNTAHHPALPAIKSAMESERAFIEPTPITALQAVGA